MQYEFASASRAECYRERAADCLAMAERAPEAVKTLLADMAASWLRLADMVEQWDAKYEAGKAAPTGGPRGKKIRASTERLGL